METKVCSMCGIEKELKLFRPDRNKCRKCNTETTRLWRIKNKGSRKKWYYNNLEAEKKRIREWYQNNKYGKIGNTPSSNIYYLDKLPPDDVALMVDGFVTVLCKYCGKRFVPSRYQIRNRINSYIGTGAGDSNFYCCPECKDMCPIFKKKIYQEDHPNRPDTSRAEQPALRELCLERDGYQCQKCGSEENLECHHFEGIEINPVESCDLDMVITLCEDCHDDAHSDKGCTYSDFRRKECNMENRE